MRKEDQLRSIAKALFWWQQPEEALASPRRFVAQVMTLGTWSEVQFVREIMGLDAFKDALTHAPPGVLLTRVLGLIGMPSLACPRQSCLDVL